MSFWDLIVSPEMAPFSAAFGLILLFLALEIVSLLAGSSLFGLDGGADVDMPDVDAPDFDLPDVDAPDLDVDFDAPDLDIDAPDLDTPEVAAGAHLSAGGSILSFLGLGDAPFMVWLTGLLAAFGLTGYFGQLILREVTGGLFAAWPMAILATVVGLASARGLSRLIARLLPRVQTEAVSERRLGARVGVITQGTAEMGRPAEAKVTDRFGNVHYIRVEPNRPGLRLPTGTEIAILSYKDRIYKALPLDRK